ncbi:hypothetical protein ACOQFV_07760 [Nocardiopsis changdeensis]|uniref:Lipoprotein n=1 Tax=Nocardiopsis changdeensis TaxID=2831969 RepID=A0ABX8BHN4_9ACTN|nr:MULTISPECIES: hypothetical protein [Nocardiopsis]QUX20542.1 hypothetical protein KGD84_18715 [Nocardiopsis changdeensis]QYX36473.1 hypothetical protein K1J57_28170 [Nocardiopsis sp. MT53]
MTAHPLRAPAAALALTAVLTACGAQQTPAPEPETAQPPSPSPSPTGPSEEELQQQEIDTVSACVHGHLAERAYTMAEGSAEEDESGADGGDLAEALLAVGHSYAASAQAFLDTALPEAGEAVADQTDSEGLVIALTQWCVDTGVIDAEGEPIDPPPGYEPPDDTE